MEYFLLRMAPSSPKNEVLEGSAFQRPARTAWQVLQPGRGINIGARQTSGYQETARQAAALSGFGQTSAGAGALEAMAVGAT
ncbi:hypothetical protein [Azohydromonas caseinilytica]|uniref:Uncharacterized protein n=1 Tax=Azohydromonas caseinilytica TaxID=2728836 RepID=A0A848FKF5_9BURK|nr:hypothetical protein [Azohydromonas caseinilytica]NML18723.1 hypothetical protein [Azohydromonas caseinilytica]